jgi:hypothetical protein
MPPFSSGDEPLGSFSAALAVDFSSAIADIDDKRTLTFSAATIRLIPNVMKAVYSFF